jgi:hypothetical protein
VNSPIAVGECKQRLASRRCAARAHEQSGLAGLERRLADRGFDALAEDVAVVLPPEVRATFAAVCAEIRDEAARRSGSAR